jgi:8-oxo-dGTP diphosphatase
VGRQKFSPGTYGKQKLQFMPAPFKAPLRAFASLVFPWRGEEILLCDIEDRGWCIPSGRVEAFETSREAAQREALEEAGAILGPLHYLGCYRITEKSEVRWADVHVAEVCELQEITMPQESLGRKFVHKSQLSNEYYEWCELTSQVFDHAYRVISSCRKFSS